MQPERQCISAYLAGLVMGREGRKVEDWMAKRVGGIVGEAVGVVHEVRPTRVIEADCGSGCIPAVVPSSAKQGSIVRTTRAQQ